MAVIRAEVRSYLYDGPHSTWDRRQRRLVEGYRHWDWRFVIRVNGMNVVSRQGFCTWERAYAALERKLREVSAVLR